MVAAYFKYMRRVTELLGAEGPEVDRQLRNIWDIGVEIANVSPTRKPDSPSTGSRNLLVFSS